MTSPACDLTVIVAAYNEEPIIAENVRRIAHELGSRPGLDWEIVCVNDGSTDRTGPIIENLARDDNRIGFIHHPRNFGQGRAIRTGFERCRGRIIVTMDADLSYGPEYIFLLYDALNHKNADIVLASPYMKGGSVKNVPYYRYFLSRLGNLYLAKMSHYSISTSTCVVRAYRRGVLETLALTSDGMELQLEILMKASLMGFRVFEIPASLRWADEKKDQAGCARVSKMHILRTIRLYLLMGWLSKPAFLFIIISLLLMAVGAYFTVNSTIIFAGLLSNYVHTGFVPAISRSLKELVSVYYYGIFLASVFILFGFLTFAFSLILLQNKLYFEELYRLVQDVNKSKET